MLSYFRYCSILLLPFFFSYYYLVHKAKLASKVIVLIFHDLTEFEIKKLNKLISFLDKHFAFITPEHFEKKEISRGVSFLITFDDGFISSYNATKIVLEPKFIKAAFFLCPVFNYIEKERVFDYVKYNLNLGKIIDGTMSDNKFPMRLKDVQGLVNFGHLIGSHTNSHPIISKITKEQLENELKISKESLQKMVGKDVEWFAYPFGGIDDIDRESLIIVKKYFKFCFTGIRGEVDFQFPYIVNRTSVTLSEPFLLQLALIFGTTNWFHFFKQKKLYKYNA